MCHCRGLRDWKWYDLLLRKYWSDWTDTRGLASRGHGRCVVDVGIGYGGQFGALFTAIPGPIVGGMYCAMFGMIASVGLSNLQFVNLNSARNLFILGFAFFMGLSVPEYFGTNPLTLTEDLQWLGNIVNTLGQTGMAVGAFTALFLDNTIPGTNGERGLTICPRGDGSAG